MSINLSTEPATGKSQSLLFSRLLLWSAWIGYIGYLLLSDLPPGNSLLHTQPETLQTAIALSLNFWFVMPLLFPNVAPVLNPALEGLFNIVVAWGLLFWGFWLDGRNQRVPMLPFLLGTALLTNVFYLPWLALRQPNPAAVTTPLSRWERWAESRVIPIALSLVFLASLLWAAFARPEFGTWGDRWNSLQTLIGSDRLAYSFWFDLLVFWLFQAWLVPDDMQRRNWQNPAMVWIVRLLPFFGLVIYLLRRPRIEE
ncbi:MAG: hypothetical protein IGS48_19565 [Oscillatoriales cyanobacterium C42_A2020_001]|nr:hypothetical protein [Leptolyngbyaceae cyanobacterium C42_A2020_001]